MAQPHVLLTVRDKRGKLLEAVQESPQVRLQGCMKSQTHRGRWCTPRTGFGQRFTVALIDLVACLACLKCCEIDTQDSLVVLQVLCTLHCRWLNPMLAAIALSRCCRLGLGQPTSWTLTLCGICRPPSIACLRTLQCSWSFDTGRQTRRRCALHTKQCLAVLMWQTSWHLTVKRVITLFTA